MKKLLLFVLAVCVAAWNGPGLERPRPGEAVRARGAEPRAAARAGHRRCAGDPDCERAARDKCFYHPSGTPGDGHYSVGQFTFFLTHTPSGGTVVQNSTARAFGPEALATNGEFAPAGTAWNDTRYATVLGGTGSAEALIIDLGKGAGRGINRVKIQADGNDVYAVDIFKDGAGWTRLYTAQTAAAGGLQTRDSGDSLTDPATGKPWVGQYIRVWPVSGDGRYSVSAVQI